MSMGSSYAAWETISGGYVLDDATISGAPLTWITRVVATYDRWEADAVVVETNQGGEMVKHTLQSVHPGIRIVEVTAMSGQSRSPRSIA